MSLDRLSSLVVYDSVVCQMEIGGGLIAINVPLVPIPGAHALQSYADRNSNGPNSSKNIYSNYLKKFLPQMSVINPTLPTMKLPCIKPSNYTQPMYITQCRCSLLTTIYVAVILDTNFFCISCENLFNLWIKGQRKFRGASL